IGPPTTLGLLKLAGALVGVAGGALALWCILAFALVAKGTPAPFDPPRRLVVAGPYRYVRNPMYLGAGLALTGRALHHGQMRSHAARRLTPRTGLTVCHRDLRSWRPGWLPTQCEEWHETVRRLVAGESWFIVGKYGGTLALRLAACDTVVFLDRPRVLCLWRVLIRQLRYFGRVRPELPRGCRERLSWAFLVWIWTYPSRRRGSILTRLRALGQVKRVAILCTAREIEDFIARSR